MGVAVQDVGYYDKVGDLHARSFRGRSSVMNCRSGRPGAGPQRGGACKEFAVGDLV
jgi:hypothetical protein